MVGHKICFNGEIWLIISKLSLLPLLIRFWSTAKSRKNGGEPDICVCVCVGGGGGGGGLERLMAL